MKYEDQIIIENLTNKTLERLDFELDLSPIYPDRINALSKLLEVLVMIDINKDEDE